MCWIQTYSGRQFYPLAPRATDVKLRDIAHSLSLICRFSGHCREFYSVAQHSVLVAHAVARCGICYGASRGYVADVMAAGLLHDAHEAYIADITSPVKKELAGIDAIEQRIQQAIHEHFGLTPGADVLATVKHADRTACVTEARDLLGPTIHGWTIDYPAPWEDKIEPLAPVVAEREFLALACVVGLARPIVGEPHFLASVEE